MKEAEGEYRQRPDQRGGKGAARDKVGVRWGSRWRARLK